jgi:tRNA(Ile)-lysidine synthase
MDLSLRVQRCMQSWAPPKARILCAVSGGPDSVSLAHLVKPSAAFLMIGHVDHQMRKGSAQEAQFVEALARRWDLPFQQAKVAVPSFATSRRLGLEEAARELRYKALVKMACQNDCSVILTGHTADDQAETVLMNFLRGAGPTGLAGIPPVRELAPGIQVIRPLLSTSRSEILGYLRAHRLSYRQDPSNRSSRFTRNRIRRRLLPLLEKEYPGLKRRLSEMAEIFRDEHTLWAGKIEQEFNKTVRQDGQKIAVDLPQLLGYHKALGRRILRHLLTGISFQDAERVYQLALSRNGHMPIHLSGGLQVERKGTELLIS